MRVPDPLILPVLMAVETYRRFERRIRSGPLYRWRAIGGTPDALTMAPQDLRPADEALATDYYSGQFEFHNTLVDTNGQSPFEVKAPNPEWFAELHSFRWLRHLNAANTDVMQANASAYVTDWITRWNSQTTSSAWRSDITAARLISWFSHAPLIIKNANEETYRVFLKSLARQTRYLHRITPRARDGYPRLHATVALAYASLCLSGKEKTIRNAIRTLDRELERQILPDGGHISRNPVILVDILADLLPLRQAYKKQGHSPSPVMLSAIDRMMGALRFFRHSNGDLAQFNGTGHTPTELINTLLRYSSAAGQIQNSAPQSGYERLSAKDTVVLMDTGRPLTRSTARRAMAGTLSFELSSGSTRFIANCGMTQSEKSKYVPFARATAAHSTAVIDNKSSSRFAGESKIYDYLPSPLLRAPDTVVSTRKQTDEFDTVSASHNGYRNAFGIVHEREINLSSDGETVNGIDRFIANAKHVSKTVTIRFHMPPNISASPLASGTSILLAAPGSSKDAWTFTCIDAPINLEESIQFSGPHKPRKSEQIVINANTDLMEVRWTFVRRKVKKARKGGANDSEADLIADLLESADLSHPPQSGQPPAVKD